MSGPREIKKIEGFNIPSGSVVNVIKAGHVYEVVYMDIVPQNLRIYKRISADEMLNVCTGEIIEIEKGVTREDNLDSLRRTLKRLRRLINANFYGEHNELFVTFTYAENMTDVKRLYKDFDKFCKKLKYRYKDIEFRYIAVIEPQERGAWHLHVLLKGLNVERLYIPNDEVMAELWGHGFTKTQAIESVDDVGAYMSSYLSNIIDDNGNVKKGARLHLYPAGVNIYRASRNCIKPEIFREEYGTIREMLGLCKTYEVCYSVEDEEGKVLNRIKKEFYNLRRGDTGYGKKAEGGEEA